MMMEYIKEGKKLGVFAVIFYIVIVLSGCADRKNLELELENKRLTREKIAVEYAFQRRIVDLERTVEEDTEKIRILQEKEDQHEEEIRTLKNRVKALETAVILLKELGVRNREKEEGVFPVTVLGRIETTNDFNKRNKEGLVTQGQNFIIEFGVENKDEAIPATGIGFVIETGQKVSVESVEVTHWKRKGQLLKAAEEGGDIQKVATVNKLDIGPFSLRAKEAVKIKIEFKGREQGDEKIVRYYKYYGYRTAIRSDIPIKISKKK